MTSAVNPSDWVSMGARATPDAPCLIRPDDRVLSLREVAADVARLAGALADHGLVPGDRIAVLGTDSVEFLELVLASMRIGATVVPVNVRLTAAEVERIVGLVRPVAFVADAGYTAPAGPWKLAAGLEASVPAAASIRDLISDSRHVIEHSDTAD